ncbi:MAG: hypothetical protein QXR39_08755 [Candidatus Methanomethylicia archaeon]
MGDAEDGHFEIDVKLKDLFRIHFRSKGKVLRTEELYGDDDTKAVFVQTDKGEFLYVFRKTKTKLKIVMIDPKTNEILGANEV